MTVFDKDLANLIVEHNTGDSIESLWEQDGAYFLEIVGIPSDVAFATGARGFSTTEIIRHHAILWLRSFRLPVPDEMLVRTTQRPVSAECALDEMRIEFTPDELITAIQILKDELDARNNLRKYDGFTPCEE